MTQTELLKAALKERGVTQRAVADDWHDGDKVTVRISKKTN